MTRTEHIQARKQRNQADHAARQVIADLARLEQVDRHAALTLVADLVVHGLLPGIVAGCPACREVATAVIDKLRHALEGERHEAVH